LFKIRIDWLLSRELAIIIVTLANVWKATSLYMTIDLSGIASISSDVLESAELDGANWIQKVGHIIVPLIKPFILLTLLISAVGTLNYYGLIYVMTYGGPYGSTTVPAFYMYRTALEYKMIGYASAVGVFIFVINMIIITILKKLGVSLT
jgi:ABC-type sugar transport system permease subunit